MNLIRSTVLASVLLAVLTPAARPAAPAAEKIVGMYVHMHWPYHHPYAARTWTFEDWQGYLDGLHRIGFNTVLIWPMLEIVPKSPTPSDLQHVQKIARVIDFAHHSLGMKAFLIITPNIIPNDIVAAQVPFERRHFFHSDLRVNPADAEECADLISRRERLLRPLAATDGLVIIDSDPGGYPGSSNREFVHLLAEHRKMLDRLRPGIELVYWMHAGWPAYSRFYATGELHAGQPAEFAEALSLLSEASPEPWALAGIGNLAERLGYGQRTISFRYGRIEHEPSFPMTNFDYESAYEAGKQGSGLGVVGNAQSHCLQLPNTFAFARGATGAPLARDDFKSFGDRLLPGHGADLLEAWSALSAGQSDVQRRASARMAELAARPLVDGPLRGLLLGDADRYVSDLRFELDLAAAYTDLRAAYAAKRDLLAPLQAFQAAAAAWQAQTGYEDRWKWPELFEILLSLHWPEIDAVLKAPDTTNTAYGHVEEGLSRDETQTPRVIHAIAAGLSRVEGLSPPPPVKLE